MLIEVIIFKAKYDLVLGDQHFAASAPHPATLYTKGSGKGITFLPLDFGHGHVTCPGQWDVNVLVQVKFEMYSHNWAWHLAHQEKNVPRVSSCLRISLRLLEQMSPSTELQPSMTEPSLNSSILVVCEAETKINHGIFPRFM